MQTKDITAKKIIEICDGTLFSGDDYTIIENFSKDTRNLNKGDMYLAIKGENIDGSNFIEEAFKKDAIGCITELNMQKEILNKYKNKVIIKVENTIEAIQKIAEYKRSLYDIPVVAVTGSVGKTSTKDIIANVLSQKFKVLKTEGNLNNHIGLPLTILELKDHEALVVEMGMNHFGEISLLTKIAKPTMCVITNIGTSHIGNLGSRQNILKAKLEILEGLQINGKVVINNDNDLLNDWVRKQNKYDVLTYGIDNKSSYVAYNIVKNDDNSTYNINIEEKEYKVKVPVAGLHFIYNSLCAFAVGKSLNIDEANIIKGILEFKQAAKRMEIVKIKEEISVINDTYNSSFDSVKAALEVLAKMPAKRRIAVLGDMLELGDFSKELHEKLGIEILKNNIDILITVGENAKYIANKVTELGMKEKYIFKDKQDAVKLLKDIMQKGDVILLKASNAMRFGDILEEIG